MKRTLLALACTVSLGILLSLPASAQSIVDFRDVIRTAEPSLLRVTVDPKAVDEAIDEAADQRDQQDAVKPERPKLEIWFSRSDRSESMMPVT